MTPVGCRVREDKTHPFTNVNADVQDALEHDEAARGKLERPEVGLQVVPVLREEVTEQVRIDRTSEMENNKILIKKDKRVLFQ